MGSTPPRPAPPNLGDWNLTFVPSSTALQIVSEQFQAVLETWGPDWHPTVDTWVQDAKGTLRLKDANGVVRPNGFRICGEGSAAYVPKWDELARDCVTLEFKVVAL